MEEYYDSCVKIESDLIEPDFLTQIEMAPTSIIDIKKEPFSDEFIKIKNEPISDDITMNTVQIIEPIKKEGGPIITAHNSLNTGFIIYELDSEISRNIVRKNVTNLPAPEENVSTNILDQQQKQTKNASVRNISSITQKIGAYVASSKSINKSVTPPPILLNGQLRKRPIAIGTPKQSTSIATKKSYYNLDGEHVQHSSFKNSEAVKDFASAKERTNAGPKRIINYQMQKRYPHMPIKLPSLQQKESGRIQTPVEMVDSTPPMINATTIYQKDQPMLAPINELKIKCICQLKENESSSSTDADLKIFFAKMFQETRCLTKERQRLVKITLLKAICESEEMVDKGKCCSF